MEYLSYTDFLAKKPSLKYCNFFIQRFGTKANIHYLIKEITESKSINADEKSEFLSFMFSNFNIKQKPYYEVFNYNNKKALETTLTESEKEILNELDIVYREVCKIYVLGKDKK